MSVAGPGALGVDWPDTAGHADEASKPQEWERRGHGDERSRSDPGRGGSVFPGRTEGVLVETELTLKCRHSDCAANH